MFYCNKEQEWKPNKNMPLFCKVKQRAEIPEGYYKVIQSRKNFLYVDFNGRCIKALNPFEDIPLYVKIFQIGDKWKIEK